MNEKKIVEVSRRQVYEFYGEIPKFGPPSNSGHQAIQVDSSKSLTFFLLVVSHGSPQTEKFLFVKNNPDEPNIFPRSLPAGFILSC